jgi:hypothetical protein
MASAEESLGARADDLARLGGDGLRVAALRCARRFKRSWVEMAEILCEVRAERAWQRWGYADLHAYAAEELLLTRRTVDKLTGSYGTLQRHAPELIADGSELPVPSCEAVQYFARLVGDGEERDAPRGERPHVLGRDKAEELREAVFEQGQPLEVLRKRFATVFEQARAANDESDEALVGRARAALERLRDLLPRIAGLGKGRLARHQAALEELDGDLQRHAAARSADRSARR